jgi:hypothetical protein
MNMACLEQLHQRKRDDETDRGPFQASQKHVKHSAPILAQAPAALNWRKSAIRTDSSSGELSNSTPCLARGIAIPRRSGIRRHGGFYCFPCRKSAALENALTLIRRFVNARLYDQKILCFRLCNRTCQFLRCASAIANPGRVARRSTGKTSHAQESSNDGVTRRNRRVFFACCCTGFFTNSQTRSQKS